MATLQDAVSTAPGILLMTFPSNSVTATVTVTVTVAGQEPRNIFSPLVSDISSRKLLVRSEAFKELAREAVNRRAVRDQEDIREWADALAGRLVPDED